MATTIMVDVITVCKTCGEDLEASFDTVTNCQKPQLSITPCEACMDRSRSEGYDQANRMGKDA